MFIGKLSDAALGIKGSYTYYRRGTTKPLFPNLALERGGARGMIPFAEGNLFTDAPPVGWKWTTTLDIGVDIHVDLAEACFIDRVVVTQEDASALAGIEVLIACKGHALHIAGRVAAPTGGSIGGVITVTVGVIARTIIIRLKGSFNNIVIKDIGLYGATPEGPVIYPLPAEMKSAKGAALKAKNVTRIYVGDNPSDDTFFAARLFAEKFAEDFGVAVPLTSITKAAPATGAVYIGKRGEMPALDGKTATPAPEGYALTAEKGAAYITGVDRRGLVYGVEALLFLLRAGALPVCTVNDAPRLEYRGVHFGIPPRGEIPFIKRLIRHVLVPMRINTIFLQITAGMKFDRHPEINAAWENANKKAAAGEWPPVPHGNMIGGGSYLTKAEVRDMVDYAQSFGLEVIPEVQSLSHVQYLTLTYPEIAEVEEKKRPEAEVDFNTADAKPADLYPHCYCPSHEKSYAILFDLIDEIIEVVRPAKYVHMGHDEVYALGVCPRCKGKDPADLFALHVNRVHEHLKRRGYGMMIWSDMLQPVTTYKTPPAITKIPKDIVLLDFIWYFHFNRNLEDNLLAHGFKVIMGNLYSSHYPRYETRVQKAGIAGAEVSTWLREDEYTFGSEGKIYDFIYSANMMWSAAYRNELRTVYDRLITRMMPRLRERLGGRTYPSLLAGKTALPLKLPQRHAVRGILGGFDTALIAPGRHELRGIPFMLGPTLAVAGKNALGGLPSSVTVPVNRAFDSLVILHAASDNAERIPWQKLIVLAAYVVEYADGKKITVPVEYGANIGAWHRRHGEPLAHAYYRHQGYIATYFADPLLQDKTPDGRDVTIYGYEWINSRGKKPVKAVHLVAADGSDAAVMLFGITGVRMG